MKNPHDKFFKDLFSGKEDAIDFVKGSLPETLTQKIDFASFQPDNTSYIDQNLADYYSDFVYNCLYGSYQVKIALLFEHKSSVPKHPHLQLLRYFLNIQEKQVKEHNKQIPVIPIIFYHGKQKWQYKPLHEYFSGMDTNLKQFIPDFEYLLIDLSGYTSEQISQLYHSVKLRMSLLLFKNIFNNHALKSNFFRIFEELPELLKQRQGTDFFIRLLQYLFYGSDLEPAYITETIKQISEKGGDLAMSTAEKLIQRGKQQGVKQGKKEDAKIMIEQGFKNETICKITGLTPDEVETLRQGDKKK